MLARSGKVIQVVTMGGTHRWVPFSDPAVDPDSLVEYDGELIFQTTEGGDVWKPAIVTLSRGQLVVTTMDTWGDPQ